MQYTDENDRDLQYYANINKVFYVVNKDIKNLFSANDVVPCIYIERPNKILKFEEDIEFDNYLYTAWRKFLGETHNIYVDVLLIKDDKLYDLSGNEVDFNQLGRSDVWISKEFLARFGLKN